MGLEPEDNGILSPLSIGFAFAMARAGADGDTAAEIDATLGFPDQGLHQAFNALERAIVTSDGPPSPPDPEATRGGEEPDSPVVTLANGLFAQRGLAVQEPFLETLAGQYGAGVRTVDFGDPPQAKAEIDAWTAEQTGERIEELFAELSPSTELVLANAVYLAADWRVPFAEYPVEPAEFTRADGGVVQADMMRQLEMLRYASGDGWDAVELPYAGEQLAMWVLVPEGEATPGDVLAPEVQADVDAGLRVHVHSAGDVGHHSRLFRHRVQLDLRFGRFGHRSVNGSPGPRQLPFGTVDRTRVRWVCWCVPRAG